MAQHVRNLKKQLATGSKPPLPLLDTVLAPPGDSTYAQEKAALQEAARVLNVGLFDVPERLSALSVEIDKLQKQIDQRQAVGPLTADKLLEEASHVEGVSVVVAEATGANPNLMRQLIDQLRKHHSPVAVLLAARMGDEKVTLVAGLSRDLVQRGQSAGNWVRDVAKIVGGGGGGKPDLAQAGGKNPERLPEALTAARQIMADSLAG